MPTIISQNYQDKYDRLRAEMYDRFKRIYMSGFYLRGLPEIVEEKWFKKTLFEKGSVAFANTPQFGLMALNYTKGLLNYYSEPITITPTSSNSSVISLPRFEQGKFVIVYANQSKQAPSIIVDVYLDKLINIEKIINQQVAQFRRGLVANVAEGKTQDVYNLFNQLDEGREEIAVWNADLGVSDLTMKSNYPPYYVGELYKLKKEIESDLLTELGVDNNAIQKESGVSDVEATANDGEVELSLNSNLYELRYGFKKVEAMFGIDIQVSSAETTDKTDKSESDNLPVATEEKTNENKTD